MAGLTQTTRPGHGVGWEVSWREDGRRRTKLLKSRASAEEFASSLPGGLRRRGSHGPRTPEAVREVIRSKSTVDPTTGCWVWSGRFMNAGYGAITWKCAERIERGAHRVSFVAFRGPVPSGLVLDHLCRNRACVNPAHLEPVTQRENVMRSPIALGAINASKTHCANGHPYTPESTRHGVLRNGTTRTRSCLICERERSLKAVAR